MPNMEQEISKHNSNIKNQSKEKSPPGCNCLDGQDHCPLGGACQTDGLVYGAKVTKSSEQSEQFTLASQQELLSYDTMNTSLALDIEIRDTKPP